jgi:GT2 family glycosyltransferase
MSRRAATISGVPESASASPTARRPDPASASIVIPSMGRPNYLEVTLASVSPQARSAGVEVVVVNDGDDPETSATATRHGARLVSLSNRQGVNRARNAGIKAAQSDLVLLLDDDVEVAPGWLEAMLAGIGANPDYEVFAGPIRARLEGGGPRACGREPPPITTCDFGSEDRDIPFVYGSNMAVRQTAFDRLGYFLEELSGRGDEEEWVLRYISAGGRIRYLGDAIVEHRRTAGDARLAVLTRTAYRHGRESRRHDVRVGKARPIRTELRILAGCAWHTVRRRCAYGIVMGARTAGSLREALTERRS